MTLTLINPVELQIRCTTSRVLFDRPHELTANMHCCLLPAAPLVLALYLSLATVSVSATHRDGWDISRVPVRRLLQNISGRTSAHGNAGDSNAAALPAISTSQVDAAQAPTPQPSATKEQRVAGLSFNIVIVFIVCALFIVGVTAWLLRLWHDSRLHRVRFSARAGTYS